MPDKEPPPMLRAEAALRFLHRGTERSTGFATALHAGFVSRPTAPPPVPKPGEWAGPG